MNCCLLVLANGVGYREPTAPANMRTNSWTLQASSPRAQQGGIGDRRSCARRKSALRATAVMFVVGLADPYGLPSADPTQPRFATLRFRGCRRQPGGERGGRQRLWRVLPSPQPGLGRLTPTTNSALGNSPLTPFPPRDSADRRLVLRALPHSISEVSEMHQ